MADNEQPTPSKADDKKLLTRIRKRYKLMTEADQDNRRKAKEDMRFLHEPGAQWDAKTKTARGTRPCYEFNKTRIKTKRIVNEMRANRPAGKVRAVEESDKSTAEVIEGIGRNILSVGDFDTICDYAGEYQVGGGMGAWRLVTKYGEDSFDQDIVPEPIADPYSLHWDPASRDPLHRDAKDWILEDRITHDAFEAKYGKKARKVDFETDEPDDWKDDETVRVVEYWWSEPYEKRLIQLVDGRVLDADGPDGKIVNPQLVKRERMSPCNRIMMCTASGDAILEGPTEQAGRYHRFFVVHGEWIVVNGKPQWWGLTRHAKDAQRSYNVSRTAVTESIATTPNSHFWATAEQAKGNTDMWDKAISENLPYLLYNADPKAPGPPTRMGSADVPMALIQEMQIADQELKDVMGVYDASLGERSNEKSGVAISRRSEQSQIVNFNFPDNMAKAKQWTVTVINDLIPFYYDTERTVRVLGADGAEDYVRINTAGIDPETGEPVLMNDLTRGKYDVTVTVGPSFSTQRQEAAETYGNMVQGMPQLMGVAGDLIFKSMDLPYADEIADRMRALLPPQIQQQMQQGKKMPPEVAAAMGQVNQAMQQVQQQGQLVQQAAQEADQKKADAEKAGAQVDTAIEQLKTAEAQFEAKVAKALAQLAQREAQIAEREVKSTLAPQQQAIEGDRAQLLTEFQNAVQGIQSLAEQFMQQAAQTISVIEQKIPAPAPPTQRVVRSKRVNGQLTGSVDEIGADGTVMSSRPFQISRQNGELVGTLQ